MKRALVIGAAGFVGPYLIRELADQGYQVVATKLPHETLDTEIAEVKELNILDMDETMDCVQSSRADVLFHLAGQSSVKLSWEKPDLTLDINIKGASHVLEAVRKTDCNTHVLLIGSAEEYGIRQQMAKVTEDVIGEPSNYYAISKYAQEQIGFMMTRAYHMHIVATRSFNHMGPGQSPAFVIADFCKQVAEVELGLKEPVIHVGNVSAYRDFTDVRDIVKAYRLLAEKGKAGKLYNVGSGTAVSISSILKEIIAMSSKKIRVECDQSRLRPVDIPRIEADISRLVTDTGWKREYDLQDTLRDTLQYWRNRLALESIST